MPPRTGPRRRSYNQPGHAHELTFSTYQGYPFLKAERTCQWLADAIQTSRLRHDFDLWSYVFMPEHVHLIVRPNQDVYSMSKILSSIKLPVARRAMDFLIAQKSPWLARITRQRGQRTERVFWQSGGGYDRNITSGKTLLRMIEYLHLNPVRRGLVEMASAWKWSSAAWFQGGTSPLALDPIPCEWLAEA